MGRTFHQHGFVYQQKQNSQKLLRGKWHQNYRSTDQCLCCLATWSFELRTNSGSGRSFRSEGLNYEYRCNHAGPRDGEGGLEALPRNFFNNWRIWDHFWPQMEVKFAVLPAVTVVLFSTTDQGYREERHTYLHCDLHLCVGYITHVYTLSAVSYHHFLWSLR